MAFAVLTATVSGAGWPPVAETPVVRVCGLAFSGGAVLDTSGVSCADDEAVLPDARAESTVSGICFDVTVLGVGNSS